MFMGMLQGTYLDRMIGSASAGFSDPIFAGERIDNSLKTRKIQGFVVASKGQRNLIVVSQKRKRGKPMLHLLPRGKVRLTRPHIIRLPR